MTLSLPEINALGLTLFRQPDAHIPMKDALEDLGLTWNEWLEQSGTLERLAECSVWEQQGRPNPPSPGTFISWANKVDCRNYAALCEAFHVPAVQIEAGEAIRDWDAERSVVGTHWRPPSAALALTMLRATKPAAPLKYHPSHIIPCAAWTIDQRTIETILREHHHSAVAYRIRIGEANWMEHFLPLVSGTWDTRPTTREDIRHSLPTPPK